ncbi:universal stress protein [Rhodospirillaceae bacterium SYSU D60014]|uniref:universal stress protein n=1 Tax=Virgifigura deserti TaxID=2268457 RepID=UPI000E66B19E
MYKKIMVPVDLAYVDRLEKALASAADLSKSYGLPVCYVGVTTATPSEVARTPQEYARKLDAFAAEEARSRGLNGHEAKAYTSHDPAVDLDEKLLAAIKDVGADLVVMASHIPGLPEHIFASNAGTVAMHADVSVFVVR